VPPEDSNHLARITAMLAGGASWSTIQKGNRTQRGDDRERGAARSGTVPRIPSRSNKSVLKSQRALPIVEPGSHGYSSRPCSRNDQ
jgi:hypothetical protein